MQEKPGTGATEKGKSKWGSRIFNFLIMGGWMLILFLVVGIIILVSVLGNC